jgi:hypothetical protein
MFWVEHIELQTRMVVGWVDLGCVGRVALLDWVGRITGGGGWVTSGACMGFVYLCGLRGLNSAGYGRSGVELAWG